MFLKENRRATPVVQHGPRPYGLRTRLVGAVMTGLTLTGCGGPLITADPEKLNTIPRPTPDTSAPQTTVSGTPEYSYETYGPDDTTEPASTAAPETSQAPRTTEAPEPSVVVVERVVPDLSASQVGQCAIGGTASDPVLMGMLGPGCEQHYVNAKMSGYMLGPSRSNGEGLDAICWVYGDNVIGGNHQQSDQWILWPLPANVSSTGNEELVYSPEAIVRADVDECRPEQIPARD